MTRVESTAQLKRPVSELLVYGSLAVNAVASLVILAIRFRSNLQLGSLFPTNGSESLMAYSIWKVVHHLPLYESPLRYPYSLTLYNYLFYISYAWILRILGQDAGSIVVNGRILTLCWTTVGIVGTLHLMKNGECNERARRSIFIFSVISGLIWLGSSFSGWYVLTLRPDIAAVALASIGVVFASKAAFRDSVAYAIVSAGLFYCGWALKQSTISLLMGTCLYFLFSKRWRLLAVVCTCISLLCGVTLIAGGSMYRYSVLTAPSVVDTYSLRFATSEWVKAFCLNSYVWIAGLICCARAMRNRFKSVAVDRNAEIPVVCDLVSYCFLTALPIGLLLLTKIGAAKNHLLEAYVMAGVLAAWETGRVVHSVRKDVTAVLVASLCVAWAGYPLLQTVYTSVGAKEQGEGIATGTVGVEALHQLITGKTPWHVQLASERAARERMQLAASLLTLRKPLYIHDEVFLLPWYATNNNYPAYNPDPIFEAAAIRKGLMKRSLHELVRAHYFASLIVSPHDEIVPFATTYGYSLASTVKTPNEQLWVLVYSPQAALSSETTHSGGDADSVGTAGTINTELKPQVAWFQ